MSLFQQVAKVVSRFEEIDMQMTNPAVLNNHVRLTELAQERSDIAPLVETYNQYLRAQQELAEAQEMLEMESDRDMMAMAKEEIGRLSTILPDLEHQIKHLLLPKDKRDDKNVFVEIRAGAGGDEAALFAADLLRMYTRYAENKGWKPQIMDENFIGVGGYKEVIFMVRGAGAYSRFKYESGVHRVQRVPATESQGRIHTSTVTVAVMAEVEEVDITLDPNDLEITATFSAGPGGQHMQKNATAARVIHKPSGIMVKIQSERSLSQNKQVAFAVIQARLQEMAEAEQNAEVSADRKSQVGSGERSEKIRTYNYPQSRVTDHRINHSSYNLAGVMDGNLDEFIDQLIVAAEAEKLAAAGIE
ncbi:MAG: peptide chain release factor 1 [Chloroflexi bacterium]|nr:peptide chain release factor 1 [Chloroflexota bacterium]MDA0242180.1 peptide chain release factor 1 [Chloroflexota bacterium]